MVKLITRPGLVIPAKRRAQIIKEINRAVFTKANRVGLDKYRKSSAVRSLGMALVTPIAAPSVILAPTGETKEVANFPYPNLDEADLPTGGYTNIDVTVLQWLSVQNDVRIHFLYRAAGQTGPNSWRKPPITAHNSQLGMSALVLPAGAYEFTQYNPSA